MADLIPIDAHVFDQLRIASTATLWSVLARMGLRNTFLAGVRPLRGGRRMVGEAFTLRYIPAREDLDYSMSVDNLTDPQRVAIERVGPNQVLVVDARGDEGAGSLGAILATRLQVRGAAGVVTDGSFRDSPEIAALDMPSYARAAHAAANKRVHHAADIQLPIGCAGVAVYPGDILVGDDEGVVVIPRHLAADAAATSVDQEHKEEFIVAKIRDGASIVGVYPADEKTTAEYEEWRRSRA